MASTSAAAKRSRTSQEQLRSLVDLLTENDGLASGKFQRLHGKLEYQRKWREVAEKLNVIGGATKSVEQWQTVWRDLKRRISNRVRDRRVEEVRTGNRPITLPPLTDFEQRIVSLIGDKYIEGSDFCPDSVTEEEELRLYLEDEDDDFPTEAVEHEATTTPSSARANRTPFAPRSYTYRPPVSTPSQTPRRGVKRRAEEEADIQRKFLEIAEKQTDALRMLAENQAKQEQRQTDATLAMAKAIEMMGEGLKSCAYALNRLYDKL